MDTVWTLLVASAFVLLGLAHSVLGERVIIGPLLAGSWSIGLSRWAADRLIRVAWHLTSVAWFGVAAMVVGADPVAVAALVALVSAVAIAARLPGHFAWSVFLVAAFAAGMRSGALDDSGLRLLGWLAVVGLVLAALVHLYWAFGGRRWLAAALPTTADGAPVFVPGVVATVLAAGAMLVQAALLGGLLVVEQPPAVVWWVAIAGAGVLALRTVGDGRYSGFTKSVRSTAYARNDDRVYTPLVVLLALASLSAVLA